MRLLIILMSLLLLSACTQRIIDIKDEKMIGKTVTVTGTAQNTIKIGTLSGFTLVDGNSTIRVSSETLPKENTKVVVKGVVIKDTLLGYYIKAEKVT